MSAGPIEILTYTAPALLKPQPRQGRGEGNGSCVALSNGHLSPNGSEWENPGIVLKFYIPGHVLLGPEINEHPSHGKTAIM